MAARRIPLKARSIVGLIPLFAAAVLHPADIDALPDFCQRLHWYVENKPRVYEVVGELHRPGEGGRRLLAVLGPERLKRILQRMLDEAEFLSLGGVRALSRYHRDHPLTVQLDGHVYRLDYEPGESTTGLFGGNSNWRGPVWFPINYLIIAGLRCFHHYYGDSFTVECPIGSARQCTLDEVADELQRRLVGLFLDQNGKRPVFGASARFQRDPAWHDLLLFSEYFHGDTGAGLGASHQTGWTGLVADLIAGQGPAKAGRVQHRRPAPAG